MHAPKCLTIAGSDPSGGAGIQGDLKTFCALGAYGMAAITALTVQNSQGVTAVRPVDAETLYEQLQAALEDGCDAIKIGMLGTCANVRAVARALRQLQGVPIVLDPVLVSSSGKRLLEPDGLQAMVAELLPMASVCTPNRFEAQELLGETLRNEKSLESAAEDLRKTGCKNVLITGGDSDPRSEVVVDAWHDGREFQLLRHPRVPTEHTRGTGCALAAAICVELARGAQPLTAVLNAREFVRTRLLAAYKIGQGRGPVNHLLLD
ncbi:MAG: bifunctional hydroxymethylpyrimidine kinase/phosphomethylpyrimidine kinase [Candidatus Sumerlaeaceae bacterium]